MSGQERLELIELTGGSDLFWAPCRLRRSKKARRVSARVLMGGEIELVLPVKHSEKEGLAFLQKQGKWLERQLSKSLAPVSLLEHLRKKPLLTIDGKKRQTTVEFACQRVLRVGVDRKTAAWSLRSIQLKTPKDKRFCWPRVWPRLIYPFGWQTWASESG